MPHPVGDGSVHWAGLPDFLLGGEKHRVTSCVGQGGP